MRDIMQFVKRQPVLSYYLLTFAISWGGVLVVIGGPARLVGTPDASRFTGVLLTTLAGPPLASLLLTAIADGSLGFRRLLSALLRWRVGVAWYGVALLTAPLSVSVSLLVLSAFSDEFTPGYLTGSDQQNIVAITPVFAVAAGLAGGFMEELGWSGFAVPRLLSRRGVVATGLFVGVLWGAWHFVSNFWGSSEAAGTIPVVLWMASLLFTFLPPYRVLMVWVFKNTKSVLVMMLMHTSLITFWLISTPVALTPERQVTWYIVWGVALWLMVAVVTLAGVRRRRVTEI